MGHALDQGGTMKGIKGFTLIEVMIVILIVTLVSGAIYSFFSMQTKTHFAQKEIAEIQQNLRTCAYLLEEEIKMAGFDPRGSAHPKILIADRNEFKFQADLNENGHPFNNPLDSYSAKSNDDENEEVAYRLSNDENGDGIADNFPCQLGRSSWAEPTQPMADNIQVLNFAYFDTIGNLLGNLPLTDDDRANIKTVKIMIVARSEHPDNAHVDYKSYFNLNGDIVLNAPNDHYHRRFIVKEICLRNL
jgi:type IV pilus assembly protein PilW